MKWTEIRQPAECGLAFCLDGIGVLLTCSPHAGLWHYMIDGERHHLSNRYTEEEAKAEVEQKLKEQKII